MPGAELLLGVDGGGTKTLAVLADGLGNELARSEAGATNPNVVGITTSAGRLVGLLLDCCRKAGRQEEDLRAAVFGLAGAGNAAVQERLRAALAEELQKGVPQMPRVGIETDARIALEGAFGGGPGIIIISGTGSSVLGKSADGSVHLVGGWGRLLGDEGSGYFIGCQALKALAGMLEGRTPTGPLRALLETRFGLSSRGALINAVYQEGLAFPSLAPIVLEAAQQGDRAAVKILHEGAALLAGQAATLFPLFPGRKGIVFVGGLIDHEGLYATFLRESLVALAPEVFVARALHMPVTGALLLARQLIEKEVMR